MTWLRSPLLPLWQGSPAGLGPGRPSGTQHWGRGCWGQAEPGCVQLGLEGEGLVDPRGAGSGSQGTGGEARFGGSSGSL